MRWILLLLAAIWPAASHAEAEGAADVAQIEACVRNYAKGAPQERVIGGCVGIIKSACGGKTTIEISDCIMRETAAWDHLLDAWLARLKERQKTSGDVDRLLADQRRWSEDREAECARVYDKWREGSIRVIFAATCYRDMAAERAVEFYYRLNE
ncbi:DUF1311 domain-containing protein [Roseovarius sp. A21]|uniref:DUF1311 domain-containing protein n=1 Tax=Roseovarius bejariae TaxID=2576383 RepID=A0A844CUI6_9RHOB|nr:lysozyme inhibitor LprI family protein [Roseovarius bejariae]MRU14350.1 DUF1311 domain-containing protein [Roseovarius bejariae]